MLRSIFAFEIRYHLRQWLFWLVSLTFLLLGFLLEGTEVVTVFGGSGNIHRNAPLVILRLLSVLTVFSLFIITAVVASSAQRDFEYGTEGLFFSKPVKKRDYLFGRFAASWLISCVVLVAGAIGAWLGSKMPWVEAVRLGPTQLTPYLYTFAVVILPDLLLLGAVFF
ncbi:MAG TPA: hypothetical protein VGE98_09930, partial [Thermoanaerobaculia bacterium]